MRFISAAISVIISAYLILTASCTPAACFEETNAYVKASLNDFETKKTKAPDSLTVYGTGMEEKKIYDGEKGVQPALFPLNTSAENCSFVVSINGVNDTITFRYRSYPHLISKECGYTFYHNIDTPILYTKHTIDYIYTSQKNITTKNVENLIIYY